MKNCDDCGKNDWWFRSQGGMTIATCKVCKNELRWAKRKKTKINNSEPDACECGHRKFDRINRPVTIDVLKLPYYFTYYFVCKKCKKEFPDKTTKKNNALYM
jgi:hypothetical protein